ncbi:MAG: hypothetical protein H6741_27270 [Alphaproteobacteria bacterium]|nr:hypothetical protein [Alphaproteobacteria bacterium]
MSGAEEQEQGTDLLFEVLTWIVDTVDPLLTGDMATDFMSALHRPEIDLSEIMVAGDGGAADADPIITTAPPILTLPPGAEEKVSWLKALIAKGKATAEELAEAGEKLSELIPALMHLYDIMIAASERNDDADTAYLLSDVYLLGLAYAMRHPSLRKRYPRLFLASEWFTAFATDFTAAFPQPSFAQRMGALFSATGDVAKLLVTAEDEAEARRASMLLLRFVSTVSGLMAQKGKNKLFQMLYGWENTDYQMQIAQGAPPLADNDPRALLERTLTVAVPGNPEWRVSALVVPRSHGGPGLMLRGTGEGEVEAELGGGWSLRFGGRFGGPAVLIPFSGDRGPPDGEAMNIFNFDFNWGLKVTAVHAPAQGHYRLGAGETHLKLGPAQLKLYLEGERAGFLGELHDSELVVAAPSGDGFLSQVMGDSSLEVPFKFGLGWDSAAGWYWSGGMGGLTTTLPWSLPVGPARIERITLSLATVQGGAELSVAATLRAEILAFTVVLDRVGYKLSVGEADNPMGFAGSEGFKRPSGAAIAIDWGPVTGNVAVQHDPGTDSYIGLGSLRLPKGYAVEAMGLVRGSAILVLGSLVFPTAPPQVGMGFTLRKLGVLAAINRRFDVAAARASLRTGALGSLLAPEEPAAHLSVIARDLDMLFPECPGGVVLGVSAQLTWGPKDHVNLDLALLYDFSDTSVLVALGVLRVRTPSKDSPRVKLNIDAVGTFDFPKVELYVFADLYDSKVMGYAISGSAAVLLRARHDPCFLISLGGFHPSYTPPSVIPEMKRLEMKLPSTPTFAMTLQAYFAIVGATIHLGARCDVVVKVGSFASLEGGVAFDTLLCIKPFLFLADARGWLTVKVSGYTFLSVRLAGSISGPRPWIFKGAVSVSVAFWDWDIEYEKICDDADITPEDLEGTVNAQDVLCEALVRPSSWTAGEGEDAGVVFVDRDDEELRVEPLRELRVLQAEVPLGVELDHLGMAAIEGPTFMAMEVTEVGADPNPVTTPLDERFAISSFLFLSEEEQLSRPAFQEHPGGAAIAPPPMQVPDVAHHRMASLAYEELLIDENDVGHSSVREGIHEHQLLLAERGPVLNRRLDMALSRPSRRQLEFA